jgi:modulator of FtsH protease
MGSGYNPAIWSTFFSAEVGASAALTGLIFVAVSINLAQIVDQSRLVTRAAKALFGLTGVLIASTLCLVPAQRPAVLGCELTVMGIILWIAVTVTQYGSSHKNPYVTQRQHVFHSVLAQVSTLPFAVGGISLLLGRGGGLYWLLVGTVFSFVAGLIDAWVLLIEIQR